MGLESASLHGLYHQCVGSFARFNEALDDEHYQIIDESSISEGFARLRIWGDQSRAVLPEKARGSLDDSLKHNRDVRKLAFSVLCRLTALLKRATECIKEISEPDSDSASSVSDDSSHSDGEFHTPSKSKKRPRKPKICLIFQQIFDQITSLFDISSLLRRPQIVNKYMSSTDAKNPETSDADMIDSNSHGDSDARHILEKAVQWRGFNKSEQSVDLEGEATDDSYWFIERLERANARRRDQFRYWAEHPDSFRHYLKDAAADQELTADSKSEPLGADHNHEASAEIARASEGHDTSAQTMATKFHAQKAHGQKQSNSVPSPPKRGLEAAEFACPYCGALLCSEEMKEGRNWRSHVFHDLRPYVCTFKGCMSEDVLYTSFREWQYHELQMHRRHYVCHQCSYQSDSRTSQAEHIQQHHISMAPDQISALLDMCDRQQDVDIVRDLCLLCGEIMTLSQLQKHLAGHMEDASLLVLPGIDDKDKDHFDLGASQPHSKAQFHVHDQTESVGSSQGNPRSPAEQRFGLLRFDMSSVGDEKDEVLTNLRNLNLMENLSQSDDPTKRADASSSEAPQEPEKYQAAKGNVDQPENLASRKESSSRKAVQQSEQEQGAKEELPRPGGSTQGAKASSSQAQQKSEPKQAATKELPQQGGSKAGSKTSSLQAPQKPEPEQVVTKESPRPGGSTQETRTSSRQEPQKSEPEQAVTEELHQQGDSILESETSSAQTQREHERHVPRSTYQGSRNYGNKRPSFWYCGRCYDGPKAVQDDTWDVCNNWFNGGICSHYRCADPGCCRLEFSSTTSHSSRRRR